MKKETKEMFEEAIRNEMSNLNSYCSESEEKKMAVENLATLYGLGIKEEESKTGLVRDLFINCGLGVMQIVLPLAFYAVWMEKGFKFETTGAYCSQTFRSLISRFRPTIK